MTELYERVNPKLIGQVVVELVTSGAKTATKYLTPELTVRASRRLISGKLLPKNYKSLDIALTIGEPNYEARQFIRMARKAGESFPVKKIQLKYPPKKGHK